MPVRLPRCWTGWPSCHVHQIRRATLPATDRLPLDGSIDQMVSPRLPENVTRRLKSLPEDILAVLLEGKNIDMDSSTSLSNVPSSSSKNLLEMAKYYFEKGGKMLRPTVTLLMGEMCNDRMKLTKWEKTKDISLIELNQYRIAMVAEMIHTASLIHDDVIDEAGTRRGLPTVNAKWGNKRAVLGGDRILSRATKVLCMTRHPDVVSTMASIVDNLVDGEFMQLEATTKPDMATRFQDYMQKSYFKTASLFANSCISVSMLADCPVDEQKKVYEFGRNLGLAFQLTDDVLDYVATSSEMGKPTASDLRQGLATAPVLFAARDFPELHPLINRRFAEEGDPEHAYEIVMNSNALLKSRDLIKQHCESAVSVIRDICNSSPAATSLVNIALSQADRKR